MSLRLFTHSLRYGLLLFRPSGAEIRLNVMAQPSSRDISKQARPHRRLGVGVLGLGRRWQSRYRPALAGLRDWFIVRAVADPVAARTEEQARELECDASAGPIDLLENPGVE